MGRSVRYVVVTALLWAAVGFGAGVVNGLLGAAGGILLVSALPHLPTPARWSTGRLPPRRWDQRDVLATALCVMLPTSALSFVFYVVQGMRPEPSLLLTIALPTVGGGLVGAFLLDRIPREALRKGFALLIVVSGLRMLF